MARDIRLILTDIDGTILPYGERVVSEHMRGAMHDAIDAGIHIGPASGRGYSHIPNSFAGDTELTATCLAANGMQVYLDGKLIADHPLPYQGVEHVTELVRGIDDAGVLIFQRGIPYIICGNLEDLAESFPTYAETARRLDSVPKRPIKKANVFVGGDMDRTQEVYQYLAERVDEVDLNVPMEGFLNLTPVGWNKASGIDVLAKALGIGLDQVAVFGDGGNDVEMLEHVPNSAAVADATPEAIAAATYTIGRCEDDAVADVIYQIMEGSWPR